MMTVSISLLLINLKKIAYLITLNVLYVVLLHTYIMITNIILDLLVILKNVTIILVLSNPLYFLEEISKLPNAINLKKLRTNINLVIEALYMYFGGSCSTRYIAKHFADIKSFKISHVCYLQVD